MQSAVAPRRTARARHPRILNKASLTPEAIYANRGKSMADNAEYERTLANAAKKDSMTELPTYTHYEYFEPDTSSGVDKPSVKRATLNVAHIGRLQSDPKDVPSKFKTKNHSKGALCIEPRVSRVRPIRYWRQISRQRRALGIVGAALSGTAFVEDDDSKQKSCGQTSDDDTTETASSTINGASDDEVVLLSVEAD